ncbi:hypothetical protein [Dapis sp. BLCC M172]
MNSHKARFVARFVENLFGREGVRLYYLILGIFFFAHAMDNSIFSQK